MRRIPASYTLNRSVWKGTRDSIRNSPWVIVIPRPALLPRRTVTTLFPRSNQTLYQATTSFPGVLPLHSAFFSTQLPLLAVPPSLSSSSKVKNGPLSSEVLVKRTRSLIDKEKILPGKYTKSNFRTARKLLHYFADEKLEVNTEAVMIAFQLMERLTEEETAANIEKLRSSFVPPYLKSLLHSYTRVHKNHPQQVVAPQQVLELLHRIAKSNPKFLYNAEAVDILVAAAVKHAGNHAAPDVCEQFVQVVRQNATELQYIRLLNDARIYSRLLDAWVQSKRHEKQHQIETFLERMNNDNVKPSLYIYCTLLTYWGKKGSAKKVDEILVLTKKRTVPRIPKFMLCEITAFCNVGKVDRAEQVLWNLVQHFSKQKDCRGSQVIVTAAKQVLDARAIDRNQERFYDSAKQENFARMEKMIQKLKETARLSPMGRKKLEKYLALMVYAPAGKFQEAEELVSQMNYDTPVFSDLIIEVAKQDADRAIQLLKDAVQKNNFSRPDIIFVHVLLHTMAETDNPDSNIFDKAYELVRFMEADPKFKEKGIQPTIKTFNLLLKCYLCTKGGVSEQVDAVLDDIAKRKAAGQSGLEMEEVTYHRAFKAYISCKNIEKALAFVESMGNSNCPPTMDTYATVLKCVSALADESDSDSLLANAELTGSVLMRLREIARPTVGVLSDYCYNLSLSAWGRCGPESSDRLLQIYDLMAKDHVPYNKYTYDKVISVLTKSTRHDLIEKADSMLREMLDDKLMQPEIKHFICVANAWITLGEKYSHQASGVLNLCFQKFVSANVNHDAKLPGFFVAMLRTFLSQGDAGNADDFMNRLLCLLDHGSEFSLDVKLKVYSFIQDEMNHADGLQNFKKEKIEAMIAEVKDRVNLSAS